MNDLPFVVEYAKSNRASCKQCKKNIGKDSLRMGIMVQSPMFDGKIPMWHHLSCFFAKKRSLKSTDEIANFLNLRWEDQEEIKKHMSTKAGKGSKTDDSDFSVEYAKSNRSTCKGCNEKISKGLLRVSKIDRDNPEAQRYGPAPQWHHVDCFASKIEELQYFDSADKLPGFKSLDDEDKKMLQEKIGNGIKRKMPAPESDCVQTKRLKSVCKEEHTLKSQNEMIFEMRDHLKKSFSKSDMIELLSHNNQHISHGESNLLDHLTDCLLFGALKDCPDCKNSKPRYRLDGYYCSGNLTEWTKCQYNTKYPEREEFLVPIDFRENFEFLKKYKYTKRQRQYPQATVKVNKNLPLSDFRIVLIGKFKASQDVIQKGIEELGGVILKTINSSVNLCIASESDIESNPPKIRKAKSNSIHVVSVDFIETVRKGTAAAVAVKDHLISSWGDDPLIKFGLKKEKSQHADNDKKDSKSSGSIKRIMKVVVSGAAAVDPDSGLEDTFHVYQKKGVIYNAVLGIVDINRGTNSFYKLQLLESNRCSRYYVFRSWGRVGTSIGNDKKEFFNSLKDAIASFKKIYLEKTGNEFHNRKKFEKKPGFMYPLDIDYGQEHSSEVLKPGINSKLPRPIQDLVCLIFDIEAMKKAMVEFELDLNKMPLGKLSKKQIQMAYAVLTEAQDILTHGSNRGKILDVSNRFFTLIPHDFGMKKPPLLDDEDIIKSKIEMLDSLLEIEFAYNLIQGNGAGGAKDPVDEHYEKLNTKIEVLEKKTKEYDYIEKYLKNTHASTHNTYELELKEIFKIDRDGESERYKNFKNLHNKKLLWHGSRVTNFVGILSQGLRIAPPEAPATGYMFGKGVYFADMVSKSANYCFTNKINSTGLLLLCEVALGDMYERVNAEFITKLPSNKHSTKGIGQTAPDPKEKLIVDDVEIPYGKPAKADTSSSSLLYNEYIVYDVNQINIKYLLNVDFKYKW